MMYNFNILAIFFSIIFAISALPVNILSGPNSAYSAHRIPVSFLAGSKDEATVPIPVNMTLVTLPKRENATSTSHPQSKGKSFGFRPIVQIIYSVFMKTSSILAEVIHMNNELVTENSTDSESDTYYNFRVNFNFNF